MKHDSDLDLDQNANFIIFDEIHSWITSHMIWKWYKIIRALGWNFQPMQANSWGWKGIVFMIILDIIDINHVRSAKLQ